MENQSTNKIICRKCGGPHFTIKCGKEKTEEKKDVVFETERNNTYKSEKYNNNNFEKKDFVIETERNNTYKNNNF